MNLYSFENDWLEICQLTHKAVTQLENAHMLNLDLIFHKKKDNESCSWNDVISAKSLLFEYEKKSLGYFENFFHSIIVWKNNVLCKTSS